ncbi:MAG TPA: sensor domain-containing diguanylate cyclase [Candidatus Binatia bacterium]|nr:sensor domain-containing diguanylate cyclase [Candidatus Binatia bacterium]
MLIPPPHPQEARRIAALRRLDLIETPLEERFECLTRLARRTLDVPIAAVSLVDEGRQWFKSVHGLDSAETARNESFCAHAILGDDVFVVPDARKDERFADHPMVVADPRLRFYAGAPLRVRGAPVGTLCVADRAPRAFGARRQAMLRSLALAVEAELAAPGPSEAQRAMVAGRDAAARRAIVDSLTRLWNREAILEILQREFRQARRRESGIGAVFVGLDEPAQLQLDLGLPASDELLRKTARRLLRSLPPHDTVGRFGGQQFLGVVTRSGRAELAAMAQEMRARVARQPVKAARGHVPVTVSVGAAWAPAARLRTEGELLEVADAALCWAQVRGGNRVEVRAAA